MDPKTEEGRAIVEKVGFFLLPEILCGSVKIFF
jgi:hypothetical protein